MSYAMCVDDERFPPSNDDRNWIICRSLDAVKRCIQEHGVPQHVSFDHDLGMDNDCNLLDTGLDVARYLIELDLDGVEVFTDDFTFYVHSMNPVGAKNIQWALDCYVRFKDQS